MHPARAAPPPSLSHETEERDMGKYFIAWLLGVPAGLLILIYVFTHVF